jgi:nicotinate-nucleotide--dimethylbenzimidazole phosphoribosyltransferase
VIERTLAAIAPLDGKARDEALRALDAKTKPRGSLGRLEELASWIAATRGSVPARLRAAVVIAAADHGVASEGVSAYPQEVTAQMLRTFEAGTSAVCVLARLAGADLRLVDAGVAAPTANIAHGPAMSREDAERRIEQGIRLAGELAAVGTDVVALGEMGIGNTTSASALTAALLGVDPASSCGHGTGLDDAGVEHKVDVVRRALAVNQVDTSDPVAVLVALGGYEIALLCGVVLGAAAHARVVVLDGFITAVAALIAVRMGPAARERLVAGHLSPEPGHKLLLDELRLEPLLDLRLRLGEGSGAVLALPLLDAAVAILAEMATFESAGVTDAGR